MSIAIFRRAALVPFLTLVVLAVGCGTDATGTDATEPGTTGTNPTGDGGEPTQLPAEPGEMVVQVLVDGGLLPREATVTTVPAVTVLGDGTVITPAPVPAIFPGPAIAPLQAITIDGAAVDGLVERADELGLLDGPLDFGQPPVADAPNTTVTIVAGGTTHRHVANALGIADDPAVGAGINESQAANRRALTEFVDATQELPAGEREWVPSTIAVYDLGIYRPDPALTQTPVAWPLTQPPATGDGFPPPCTLIEPDDTQVLQASLADANTRTPWIIDGQERSLAFRPVVAGQPGCPS